MKVIEAYIKGKSNKKECEDVICITDNFVAVIDGVTSKSVKMYDGHTGGYIAAYILSNEIRDWGASITAENANIRLNDAIASAWDSVNECKIEDATFKATAVVYSKYRQQV